jgi:putative inorganic carbon (hco3(-)) transporter
LETLKNSFFKKYFDVFIVISLTIAFIYPSLIKYSFETSAVVLEIFVLFIIIYTLLKCKQYILYGLAFLIPLSFQLKVGGGSNINFPSEGICLVLMSYLGIKAFFNLKTPKSFLYHPVTILFFIDIVWLIITSSVCELKDVAFKRTAIKLMYVIVYYYLFNELFRNNIATIFKVFLLHALGMVYPIIHATIFHAQLNFSTTGGVMSSLPFYNDHTIYGAALALLLPFLIHFLGKCIKEKNTARIFLSSLLLCLFLVGIFLSYSRAAWLSLMIAFGVYLLFVFKVKGKSVLLTLLVTSVSLLLFWNSISDYIQKNKEVSHKNDISTHFKSAANVKTDASNTERINRWKCAWRMFVTKPVFGYGTGSYQFFYGSFQQRGEMTAISTFKGNKGHAHSEYLNSLSETGFIGALNFILLLIFTSYFGIKLIYNSTNTLYKTTAQYILLGFFTYIVHAFFNGFLETDKIAMPFYACISAIVALDINEKTIKSNEHVT